MRNVCTLVGPWILAGMLVGCGAGDLEQTEVGDQAEEVTTGTTTKFAPKASGKTNTTQSNGFEDDCAITGITVPQPLYHGVGAQAVATYTNAGTNTTLCRIRVAIGEGSSAGGAITGFTTIAPGVSGTSEVEVDWLSGPGTYDVVACAEAWSSSGSIDTNPSNDCQSLTITVEQAPAAGGGDCSVTDIDFPQEIHLGDGSSATIEVRNLSQLYVGCKTTISVGAGTACGYGYSGFAGYQPGETRELDLPFDSFQQCGPGMFTMTACATSLGEFPIQSGESQDDDTSNDCQTVQLVILP